jgi:hypothetical protein
MVSDLTTLIVAPTLADKFHHALQSPQQMFETRVYICFPLIPGPKEPIKKMTIFEADGRVEKTLAMGRSI